MLSTTVSQGAKRACARSVLGSMGSCSDGMLQSRLTSSSAARFSSAAPKIDPSQSSGENVRRRPSQSFVKIKLEPGEWDEARTDPIHTPPWKNRARVISAEDFAARPRVSFREEFRSMKDAMVVLSWLTQEEREGIYQLYLDMMTTMSATESGTTSHEYVMRVIGQRYNISSDRVAAIVELQHIEDQLRRNDPEYEIRHHVQEHVDAKVRTIIRENYAHYKEVDPIQFVEDPPASGVSRRGSVVAGDLVDVDRRMRDALIREKDEARLAIDSHVYVEDVDDSTRLVKVSKECERLVKEKNLMSVSDVATENSPGVSGTENSDNSDDSNSEDSNSEEGSEKRRLAKKLQRTALETPLPENYRGHKSTPNAHRPRWKFAAKSIDVHDANLLKLAQKKTRRVGRRSKASAKRDDESCLDDTLVEHNGVLRAATVEEGRSLSWKPTRHPKEFKYRTAKKAWLDMTLRGKGSGVWGRQEERKKEEKVEDEEMESLSSDSSEGDDSNEVDVESENDDKKE